MEGIIDSLAVGIANFATFLVTSGIAFVVFGVLWISFAAAIVWSQGSLQDVWQWIGSLHILAQLGIWLLFLPVMAGLWVWETSWPFIVRLLIVGGLAGWTMLMFFPRALLPGR